jgi:hypothetical protein
MLPPPLRWYFALVVVLCLGGVFVWHVARTDRRAWVQSGRSSAEYDERLRRYRRRLLPRVVLCAVLFLLVWLGGFPHQVGHYLGLVPLLVLVPFGLYDFWKDRGRLTQDRGWRINALWHAVLLAVLFGLTGLVMPVLLSLP